MSKKHASQTFSRSLQTPKYHISYKRTHLVLGSRLRELKVDTTASQLAVNLGVRVQSVVCGLSLLLVKNDLQDLGTILLGTETLANDLNWIDEVGQDGIVDGGECSGTRTLLGLGCSGTVGSLWAGEDTARCKEDDVAVGELLLKLTGETVS